MTLYRIVYQYKTDGPWLVYRSRANNLTGIYNSPDSVRRAVGYMQRWIGRADGVRVETAEVAWGNSITPLEGE